MEKKEFGKLPDGTQAYIYTLKGPSGIEMTVTDYGAAINSLKVPGKTQAVDVVLGFDDVDGFVRHGAYFGAAIGRFGNRIAGGHLSVSGKDYQLYKNEGDNHLHGGKKGFDKVMWLAEPVTDSEIIFSYTSPDGEENYPGTLRTDITYRLTDDALEIEYEAVSDKETVINLTNHAYFNLGGEGDILDHFVKINASAYLPTRPDMIPTGEVAFVEGTPFDLRSFKRIRDLLSSDHGQIKIAGGIDHNFVLDSGCASCSGGCVKLFEAGSVYSEESGVQMDVLTTLPGMQFYTGNLMSHVDYGKGGAVYDKNGGICLETQFFPDSVNQPSFDAPIFRTGEHFSHKTVYRFGVRA